MHIVFVDYSIDWPGVFFENVLKFDEIIVADSLDHIVPCGMELRKVSIRVPTDVTEVVEDGITEEHQAVII